MDSYRKIIEKIKEPVNILYVLLFGLALYFLISDVGVVGATRFIATVYCILQVFRNYTRLQILVRNSFKLKKEQYIPLIITSIIVVLLVLLLLNDYLSRFVIYGSIIMGAGFILFELFRALMKKT